MKVLTIDIGNTSTDLCLFKGDLLYLGKFSHFDLPKVEADIVLVSSVKPSVEAYIKEKYPEARFIGAHEVPVETSFLGKEGVGIDRLINLYGALEFYGKDLIVVSAGTALVVDLLLNGVFEGGFISMGIGSGLECLSKRAELIPEVKLKEISVDIGRNTEEALLGGFINQAKDFVMGCLNRWSKAYGRGLKLVITGGDGYLLRDLGVYDPLLIHKGMLALLKFSLDKTLFLK